MALVQPVRLQLRRAKGFNLQRLSLETNGLPAKSVARPHKWGNPFVVGQILPHMFPTPNGWRHHIHDATIPFKGRDDEQWEIMEMAALTGKNITLEESLYYYEGMLRLCVAHRNDEAFHGIFDDIRHHNLACYCPLDKPCHADVLLEVLRETV